MGYSLERKAAVLKRMLPPNNVAIRQLSREEGISEATLFSWRAEARNKGQLLPDADASPEGRSSRNKFAAVLETAVLNEADLAEYCRERGLYPAQTAAWRVACEQANDWDRTSTARLGRATKEEKSRSRTWNVSLPVRIARLPKPQHCLFCEKRPQRSGGDGEDA
jgi:transposase-like protein